MATIPRDLIFRQSPNSLGEFETNQTTQWEANGKTICISPGCFRSKGAAHEPNMALALNKLFFQEVFGLKGVVGKIYQAENNGQAKSYSRTCSLRFSDHSAAPVPSSERAKRLQESIRTSKSTFKRSAEIILEKMNRHSLNVIQAWFFAMSDAACQETIKKLTERTTRLSFVKGETFKHFLARHSLYLR